MKKTADVVVIGGGVVGCSILFNLARKGVTNTVLVERQVIGAGSTGKASAITCCFSALLFTHTQHFGEVSPRLAFESQKILRNFKEVVGADSGFRQTGVMIFVPRQMAGPFKQSIALLKSLNMDAQIISGSDAKELAPYLQLDDGDCIGYEAQSGYADPGGVAQGYGAAARDLRATLSLGNAALEVRIKGGRVTGVVTEKGVIESSTVVMATGAWTGRLSRKLGLDLPLVPTRHQVFFLRRAPSGPPSHPVVLDMVNMAYFRPESPDLTLVGELDIDEEADPEDYDQKTSMDFVQRTWERAAQRMPALQDAELFTSYAGLYTNTPDSYPIIDRAKGIEGLYICAGCNGYGFKISPAVGVAVSELIMDGKSKTVDMSALGMDRFQRVGMD